MFGIWVLIGGDRLPRVIPAHDLEPRRAVAGDPRGDPNDVIADRVAAEPERPSDRLVRLPGRDEFGDLELTVRQPSHDASSAAAPTRSTWLMIRSASASATSRLQPVSAMRSSISLSRSTATAFRIASPSASG